MFIKGILQTLLFHRKVWAGCRHGQNPLHKLQFYSRVSASGLSFPSKIPSIGDLRVIVNNNVYMVLVLSTLVLSSFLKKSTLPGSHPYYAYCFVIIILHILKIDIDRILMFRICRPVYVPALFPIPSGLELALEAYYRTGHVAGVTLMVLPYPLCRYHQ